MQELKKLKNVPAERSLLDFMDSYELAVNSFRISQTELRIRNLNIKGQKNLENTAEVVGKMVRKTTQEISGFSPENLPRKEDIKTVKKVLKDKNKRIKAIDKPKKLPKKKP
jgi:DNA-damage-inducible protein D